MNLKLLPLIVFVIWSAICWRWYTCGIKGVCDTRQQDIGGITTPAIEPDTTPTEPIVQPLPEEKPIESIDKVQVVELKDRMVIHFPYSSTRREDNDAIDDYLARLATQLKNSGGSVNITGHTDFVGESKDNYNFGLRRAYGLRDILVKKGVKKSQIKCKSFGETKPVATNDTALGRYKNRRAEIRVSN